MKTNKLFNRSNIINKTVFLSLLALTFNPQSYAHAANFDGSLNEVKISDSSESNLAPTAEIKYTQNENTVVFDASASSDIDGNIVEFKWNFGDGTFATGATTSHQFSTGNFPVTLTTIDDTGNVTLSQINIIYNPSVNIAVSFQPSTSSVPTGYLADNAKAFDVDLGYGWTKLPLYVGLERDNPLSPDQAYDTFIRIYDATETWEVVVPNGTYRVTVCMGDPKFPSGVQFAQAEGIPVIDGLALNYGSEWVEKSQTITVSDGKLTLTFNGAEDINKLCWIKIDSQL